MGKKFWILVFVFITSVVSVPVKANGPFEGEMDFRSIVDHQPKVLMVVAKGRKVKITVMTSNGTVIKIYDLSGRTLFQLMPGQKQYERHSLPKQDSAPEGILSKTGKTERILGYPCEEWVYEDGQSRISAWCTTTLGTYTAYTTNSFSTAISQKGLIPLKFEGRYKDGSGGFSQEAAKIEKRTVDPSEFDIPSDYKEKNSGATNI